MAFGVIVSDARSTNRTSIAGHLSISVFYDTSFIFNCSSFHIRFYFISDRLWLFVSSFHTFQRIGKYSHKLTHFFILYAFFTRKILSLIWVLFRLARLSNNFYVLNFGTLILYGQKTFDIFLYEHYHSLLYQVSVFPYSDCLSIIHSALVVVPLVWGDIVSAQGIIAYISLLQ